jgi:hypothetical protein
VKLGPYEVGPEAGRGGMGVVYRGTAPDGRPVAIKVLNRLASRELLARFERERRLLSALGEADGFVPLLDAGDGPQGPYIVMPFVGGGTLAARLENGPLAVADAVAIARDVARALAAAHAHGIVHRDLKPQNVLFTESGRPLVSDLGLAKHFRHDVSGASLSVALTAGDAVHGTVGYMAPEQLASAKEAGPPADVYSFGVMLYECLAGERPFEGGSALELLARAEAGEFEPLAKRRPETPAWLAAIVARALAKAPADRFADGGELARALDDPPREATPGPGRARLAALALLLAAIGLAAFARREGARADDLRGLVFRQACQLVGAGVPADDGALEHLAGLPGEDARWLPYLRAESRVLAGDPGAAKPLVLALAEGPERALLESELAGAGGDLEAAWGKLEKAESAKLPWHADSPGDRWGKLAARLERAGKTPRAVQAWLLAADRARDDRSACEAIEHALALDLLAVAAKGPKLALVLERDAAATLARASDAALVTLARRRLLRARLLTPEGAWPEAGDALARLAASPDPSIAKAARPHPWPASVDQGLPHLGLSTAVLAKLDSHDEGSWPVAWRAAVDSLEGVGPDRCEVLLEWLLWRPEATFLWCTLGRLERSVGAHKESRLAYEAAAREKTTEARFWLGGYLLADGENGRALAVLEECCRIGRERNDMNTWHRLALARARLAVGGVEQARAATDDLRSIEHGEAGGASDYWETRARAEELAGDPDAAAASRARSSRR